MLEIRAMAIQGAAANADGLDKKALTFSANRSVCLFSAKPGLMYTH